MTWGLRLDLNAAQLFHNQLLNRAKMPLKSEAKCDAENKYREERKEGNPWKRNNIPIREFPAINSSALHSTGFPLTPCHGLWLVW